MVAEWVTGAVRRHPLCNGAANAPLSGIATGDDRHWKPSRYFVNLDANWGLWGGVVYEHVYANSPGSGAFYGNRTKIILWVLI
jgi:hypothetical protein